MLGNPSKARQNSASPTATVGTTSEAAYEEALSLLGRGRVTEALAIVDKALLKEPSNPQLHNLRGLASSQLGRTGEAEASFREVIKLSPHSATGYANLAVLLAQSGRQAEAVKLFREALKRKPLDFTALVGLGTTLCALQNYAEAAPYLENAWKTRPGDFQTGYDYARVLHELKHPADAQRILARIKPPDSPAVAARYYTLAAVVAEDQGNQQEAARLYGQVYSLVPNSFGTYLSLVRVLLATRAASPNESLPAAPTHLSVEQHFALGVLLASRGAYREAVPHFEETLREEPSSYSATYNLALAYKGSGNAPAALRLLEHAVERKPTAELYNLLAQVEEGAGRYVEAVRHFQRAVELEPSNEQYYFDLGAEYLTHFTFGPALEVFRVGTQKFPMVLRQYVGMGLAHVALREYSEAADAFLSALVISPVSPIALQAWNALPAFLATTDWAKMLPRLQHLVERYPETPEALYCYGVMLSRQGIALARTDSLIQAQSLLERAVHLKPNFADAHLELGNVYAARKETAKAASELRQAIQLNPDSEIAHYRLGQIYRDLGELASAQHELGRYSELTRARHERIARSRSAIKQFITAQPESSGVKDRAQMP